jgi:indole-3-glycerol phosphate synthase
MSVLQRIFEERRLDVETSKSTLPMAELKERIRDNEPPRGFLRALHNRNRPVGLIAEIKPASPSQGEINPSLDPAQLARQYESAGAHALSVLTEPRHFGGSRENLIAARKAVSLPVLRKDFLDDPYQIYESRAWGSDAVLLIVAALEKPNLEELLALTVELGMDALVEVHTEFEAKIALEAGSKLIGVNCRDLATLKTDLSVVERIMPMIKEKALSVAESALSTFEDIERVRKAGADAVLIGTAFCREADVESKVRGTMGW